MRLINAQTLQFEEFANEANVQYAILSHRWEDEEVTFEDMQSLDTARTKKGFSKIQGCCHEALRENIQYCWVDTCCINKSSSAELSEAINSMFRWYQAAQVCYAYLSDVGREGPEIMQQFVSSEWFARGWTLQELLAPTRVLFYNNVWLRFGSKSRLGTEINHATSIPSQAIQGIRSIFTYSVAERMHWAADRVTTRPEDRAYSLMGLFGVNMPMLYGEGEKAFTRLQEEILKHSDDQSIFTWTGVGTAGSGLLARSPQSFGKDVNLTMPHTESEDSEPYTMTNHGLSITLALTPWLYDTYLAFLNCIPVIQQIGEKDQLVGIFLQRTRGKQFRRVSVTDFPDVFIVPKHQLRNVSREVRICAIYVRQDDLSSHVPRAKTTRELPLYGLKLLPIPGAYMPKDVSSQGQWDPSTGIARLRAGQTGLIATINFESAKKPIGLIKIGLSFDFRPRIILARNSAHAVTTNEQIMGMFNKASVSDLDFTEIAGWLDGPSMSNGSIYETIPNIFIYQMPPNLEYANVKLIQDDRLSKRYGGLQPTTYGEIEISGARARGRRIWSLKFDF